MPSSVQMSSQGDEDSPAAEHRGRAVHFQDDAPPDATEAAPPPLPPGNGLRVHPGGSGSMRQQVRRVLGARLERSAHATRSMAYRGRFPRKNQGTGKWHRTQEMNNASWPVQ